MAKSRTGYRLERCFAGSAEGKLDKHYVVIACMDFRFIGGSMGSVVGEKIAMAADQAMKRKCPLVIISKSGGARMMEAGFSLMQMAKTSAKLTLLAKKKLPYISVVTDPTTGGVTASFAMLGDLNIAEPKALVAFAGPRVVRETIGRDLPEGFQTSEFVLEHGFLDKIVHRKELKSFSAADLPDAQELNRCREGNQAAWIAENTYLCALLSTTMYLTTEAKKDIFKEHGGTEKNTGVSESQIALFTSASTTLPAT